MADIHRWLTPGDVVKLSREELWDAVHESIFDAVRPPDEPYDREASIAITAEGFIAPDQQDVLGDADAFKSARLDFKGFLDQEQTFQVIPTDRASVDLLNIPRS
jgi:hypothetical protein